MANAPGLFCEQIKTGELPDRSLFDRAVKPGRWNQGLADHGKGGGRASKVSGAIGFCPLHGGGLVALVLTQEQEVLAQLVLAQSGRVALEMLGELADITDVLLFGGSAKIFELDVLLELGDRRIVNYHRPGRMPVSAGNFPAKLNMQPRLPSPRRVAAQFNHAPQRTRGGGTQKQRLGRAAVGMPMRSARRR